MNNTYNPEDFWNRVKILLKQKNITQLELEKIINIPDNTIKQQIFHKRSPDVIEALSIANYLGTTIEYLVTGSMSDERRKSDKLVADIQKLLDDYSGK